MQATELTPLNPIGFGACISASFAGAHARALTALHAGQRFNNIACVLRVAILNATQNCSEALNTVVLQGHHYAQNPAAKGKMESQTNIDAVQSREPMATRRWRRARA